MTPFPYPCGATPGTTTVSFFDDTIDMQIKIIDEGAGHFAEISTEGKPWRVDPAELKAIAEWVAEACAEMDAGVAAMSRKS